MATPITDDAPARRFVLVAILLLTVGLGARGITDEASVMLGGDMARYIMNGVFLHDLVADGGAWSIAELANYAERYYARYPALSLGHHPPLPSAVLVPVFWVFGVSVFAARLAALGWYLFAAWGVYALTRRLFDWRVASWATAFFVTNLIVLRAGQYVLSEMPALALTLLSLNALLRYCSSRKASHFAWFVVTVATSLVAKQLTVFMLPVYATILVTQLGWRSLVSRHVVYAAAIAGLVIVPIAVMTFVYSPGNITLATNNVYRLFAGLRLVSNTTILTTIINSHLSPPVLFVVVAGAAALALRRDRRVIVVAAWLVAVNGGTLIFAGPIEPGRYSFNVLPAYFLLAASLVASPAAGRSPRFGRRVFALLLASAVGWQCWQIRNVRPSGAGGYEAAAQWVIAHSAEPVVLFDTPVDTGYFAFFVRKHDSDRRLVLLRADKVMPVPASGPRRDTPDTLYAHLRRFGVRYIVVEEHTNQTRIVPVLRQELRTDRFLERTRIPIVSREAEVQGGTLVIYEFKDAQPPDLNTFLDIGLPLGNREIKLRLRDMVGGAVR